jgi:hypothetical protein
MATAKMRRLLPYTYGKEALVPGSHSSQVLISMENLNNISFAAQVRQDLPRKFISGGLCTDKKKRKFPHVLGHPDGICCKAYLRNCVLIYEEMHKY